MQLKFVTSYHEKQQLGKLLGQTRKSQKPVARSVQLLYYACVMSFLQTSLFLDFFSHKIGQF